MNVGLIRVGEKKWIAGIIYLHNLIRSMEYADNNEKPDFTLFVNSKFDPECHTIDLGEKCPPIQIFNSSKNRSFLRQLYDAIPVLTKFKKIRWIEQELDKYEIDVAFPANAITGEYRQQTKLVSWIPDFQHLVYPEFYPGKDPEHTIDTVRSIIQNSDHLVLSSYDALSHFKKYLHHDGSNVSVLPFASVPDLRWFNQDCNEVRKEYGLPEKYLYFPSQFWAHKNHITLFKALKIIKRTFDNNFVLVCTGAQEDFRNPDHFNQVMRKAEKLGVKENIRLLGLLPRDKQVQLIRSCTALVQPSLFEGWSALVEDARLFNKPIFLSDIPIHGEQDPDRAYYFSPENEDELAASIIQNWKNLTRKANIESLPENFDLTKKRIKTYGENFISIMETVVHGVNEMKSQKNLSDKDLF